MAAVLNNLSPEINDRNIICIVSVLWPKFNIILLGDHWSRGRTGWRGQIVCSRNRNLCVRTTNNNARCSNNRRSNFGHNSCIFVLPGLFTQLVAVVTKRVIITTAKVMVLWSLRSKIERSWFLIRAPTLAQSPVTGQLCKLVSDQSCSILIGAHQSWTGPAMSSDSSSRLSVRTPMFHFGCIIPQTSTMVSHTIWAHCYCCVNIANLKFSSTLRITNRTLSVT